MMSSRFPAGRYRRLLHAQAHRNDGNGSVRERLEELRYDGMNTAEESWTRSSSPKA
jgi:hypothetical protein